MTLRAPSPFRALKSLLLMASVLLVALPAVAEGRSLYVAGISGEAALGTVSVIDTANNTVAPASIPVGNFPLSLAITPDGSRVYVSGSNIGELCPPTCSTTVTAIDTNTNSVIGGPITVGDGPVGIAITPDGTRAYVANADGGTVSVIDTDPSSLTYNATIQTISAPGTPVGVAITPDGSRAYVTVVTVPGDPPPGGVAKLDIDPSSLAYNTFVGSTLDLGGFSFIPGITPDGSKLYVPLPISDSVKVVDTNPSSGSYGTVTKTISGIASPFMVGVNPDGSRAYATSGGALFGGPSPFPDTVAVIDTSTDTTGAPITTGTGPLGVAFTPDGAHAYVANVFAGTISDVNTVSASTTAIAVAGSAPTVLAVQPAQGPVADFTANPVPAGQSTTFSASAAGLVTPAGVRYDWSFGDGETAANAGRTPSHTYANPGTYDVTLTVVADYGPTGGVFTGQTASVRQGAPTTASKTTQVSVSDVTGPTVKVKSPRKNQKMKRRKFRRARGTATDSSGVNKVTYSLFTKRKVRKSKHTRKTTTLCRYVKKNSQLTGYRSCNKVNYLTAKGTTSWVVKIKHLLPRGKYTLYVKATDGRGNTSEPVKVSFRLV